MPCKKAIQGEMVWLYCFHPVDTFALVDIAARSLLCSLLKYPSGDTKHDDCSPCPMLASQGLGLAQCYTCSTTDQAGSDGCADERAGAGKIFMPISGKQRSAVAS